MINISSRSPAHRFGVLFQRHGDWRRHDQNNHHQAINIIRYHGVDAQRLAFVLRKVISVYPGDG